MIDYKNSLYRRNNLGKPCVWFGEEVDSSHVAVYHGMVGGKISRTVEFTHRLPFDELTTRFTNKQKVGYKFLSEIRDDHEVPSFDDIRSLLLWLEKYLPSDRTTADGNVLAMLAKSYDKNVFKRCPS